MRAFAWIVGVIVPLFLVFAGCSGKSSEENRCLGVVCERGVCDSSTGTCENAGSCLSEDQCIAGWVCNGSACEAQYPCDDDAPCERGVCRDGACGNAEICSEQSACLPGYGCDDDGACVVDPCGGIDCARGVCNPTTSNCVNSDVCSIASQATDCLDGYFCYGQTCEFAETICDELDCERGVCDAATQECVSPETCADDIQCLEGFYCDDGECAQNQCDVQMQTCARGECDPTDARCYNAEVCDEATDCIDGWVCANGSCLESDELCDGGCPGTQACLYNADELTAECVESGTCYAAIDCTGGRVCEDNRCGAGTACVDDALEPNDSDASAIVITDLAANWAEGSICVGDTDVFSFDTADSPLFRGTLVVDLSLAAVDVGAGTLKVEVERPDGSMVDATTDAGGVAKLELDVGVLDSGVYLVRVSDDGEVGPTGLDYGLYIDLLDDQTVAACAAATPIGPDSLAGDTNGADSYLLSGNCDLSPNDAGENIYTFNVAQPSWVRIVVDPDSTADLTVSIRERCEAPSIIECRNNGVGGQTEVLARFLPPGDYYLLIEGAGPSLGGPYMASVTAMPVVCSRDDASCVDEMTSSFCNGQGTGFEEQMCDTSCDDATGRCARLPGDVCFTAIDASMGISDSTDWDTLTNDYDPGANGCVPDTFGTQTAGPDKAYYVELPPGYVLNAVQTLGSGDRGSLYLVDDCENLSSCLTGVNANTGLIEELTYFNTTPDPQQLWLIADTEADSFGYNVGDLSISVEPTICTPGSVQCNGADVAETCQPLGTAYDSAFCSFGCAAGVCNSVTNQDCSSPIDLIANGPVTARIDEYSGTFNPGFSGCTRRSSSGPDAVYSVTPAAGEIAQVTVTADFDASLYALTDCTDPVGTCVAGSDITNVNDETIEFAGDGVTTYFVMVDSQFNGAGIYTISAGLQQPTCTPGVALQCLDATTLEYCSDLGIEAPYTCATSCSGASCDSPAGQICADAILMTDGQSYSGTINVPNTIDPGVGVSGACDFPSDAQPYGSDVIFAVDLLAGEWLFVDYDMNSSFAIGYILTDCSDTDSCVARSIEAGIGQAVYESPIDQRVFFVLDRTTTTISTLTYTVDVDVRRQDCVPGSPAFCSDVDTIAYCDNLGFSRDYTCNGTCTGGFCDMPLGDECIDAIRVTPGTEVSGDWSDGTNNVQPLNVLEGSCEFDATTVPSGPEDIYAIDLFPGDLLQATLDTNYGSAYHYILEDCFDTSTCADNNFDRGDGVVSYYSEFGGTVFVIVDASSTFSSTSPYTLRFDVSSGGFCAPNQGSCELGTLTTCDATGTGFAPPVTCGSGCATPQACAADLGTDLCSSAPLTTGTSVYASFADFTNDMAISSSGCTGSSGLGNDMIYAVSAGPGDVIHATMKSVGFESVQLYIATDCADPDGSCEVGTRGDSSNFAEVYFTPTTFQTYYVVAESTSSFSDEPFLFDVEVIPPECVPGDYQCAPAGGVMLECNAFGIWENYPCSGGCMNDTCGVPIGQACFDAIPLGDGDSGAGAFDAPDDLNPGTGQVGSCDFGTQQANGSDTIYSVDLLAGDVLNVDYTSSSSFGILYLLSDCDDTSSCLANTDDGTSGSLQYAATVDETIFIILDRTSTGTTTLSYTVDVEILRPDCTPGAPSTCLDANTLQYCDTFGFTRDYTCGGATGTCTNGACDTPTADVCVDAGVLVNGSSVTGDFNGTDDSSPNAGTFGACTIPLGDEPDGVDHFYQVDLLAGEWFIANYTTTTPAITYLVDTCGDMSTCRAISAEQAGGQLAYQALVDETLFFVMDRTTSGASAIAWDLDVIIGTPNCTPGATQCGDATTLQWCNSYGFFEDWGCSTTCTAGACDDPSAEICVDAAPLVNGSLVTDDFDGTNDVDLGEGAVGMCAFGIEDQPGTDRFYRFDLLAGETATVDWTSTSSYAMLYFTTDCADPSACVSNTATGNSGTIAYTATSAETVYLVVDRNLTGTSSLTYELDVTIN